MDWSTHPLWIGTAALAGAFGAWLRFRLGRGDQLLKRIRDLEQQVDELHAEVRDMVELRVANAVLTAENERLAAENDALRAAAHRRRASDIVD